MFMAEAVKVYIVIYIIFQELVLYFLITDFPYNTVERKWRIIGREFCDRYVRGLFPKSIFLAPEKREQLN